MGACGSNTEIATQHQNNSVVIDKTRTSLEDVLDVQKRKDRTNKLGRKAHSL